MKTVNKLSKVLQLKSYIEKTLPGDKNTMLEPETRFYDVEGDNNNKEPEGAEILVKSYLSRKSDKLKHVKKCNYNDQYL